MRPPTVDQHTHNELGYAGRQLAGLAWVVSWLVMNGVGVISNSMNILGDVDRAKSGGGRVEVQKRDAEILLYLNEMGWASAEVVALKFYCEGPLGYSESKMKTAQRRLWLLKNAGFLRSFRLGRGKSFYVTTPASRKILEAFFPDIPHLKPIQHVSFQINDHTEKVHWSRLALEFCGESLGWRSERRLKVSDIEMQKRVFDGRYQPYLPDGVYLNSAGKKCLFEYENAQKTSKQRERKLEQINRLLEYFPKNYEQVQFVCTTDTQAQHYENSVGSGDNYSVLSLESLLKKGGMADVWK